MYIHYVSVHTYSTLCLGGGSLLLGLLPLTALISTLPNLFYVVIYFVCVQKLRKKEDENRGSEVRYVHVGRDKGREEGRERVCVWGGGGGGGEEGKRRRGGKESVGSE